MPHDELKPKDRVVLRMTRDGAVEENLTEGTSEKVSKRLEDAQLVAPHDTETGDIAEEVNKRRQLRPDELEDAVSQAQAGNTVRRCGARVQSGRSTRQR